jgi:lipopolysaccharide assembly LptE-like protein
MTRVLVLAALLAGCGYHLTGSGGDIPGTARTVSIALFTNHTREVALEVRLRRAIEDEFRRRGPLRVVEGEDGDVVLSGDIRTLRNVPVAFSATDEAVQYQGVIVVGMRLTERATGRTLQENKALQESQDFGAVSGVVITTSPHFQRGTLDGRDLLNLTNVQIGETRRRAAERDLLEQVARDIYSSAMEGF